MSRVLLALAVPLLLLGCGLDPDPDTGPDPGSGSDPVSGAVAGHPSVVLIVVDTLRADHLGAYGYSRPTSPNLDALAASGALFEQARSQAACTFPSVNSMLTSRHPIEHLREAGGSFLGIAESFTSLPEVFRANGYSTLAISASPIVRATPSRFNPDAGFGRGFDTFDESCLWESAACLREKLEAHLATLAPPYFVYLHFMDPHGPYRPPEGHRERFVRPYEVAGSESGVAVAAGDPNPFARRLDAGEPHGLTARDLEHLVDLYDEEIATFDDELPALLEALRGSVLLLTSDHGENFLDHGTLKHCNAPYDTQVRVPLILSLPDTDLPAEARGVRVAQPVSLLDVVPTLLDLAGLEQEESWRFVGRSLLSEITDASAEPRAARASGGGAGGMGKEGAESAESPPVFHLQDFWRGVTAGRHKLLFDMEAKRFELYDLQADPAETRDLLTERPEDFRRLRRLLYEWLREVEGEVASERSRAAAEEAERRLRALGYL